MGLLRALTGDPLQRIAKNIPGIQNHFVMGWVGRVDASMRAFDLPDATENSIVAARGVVAAHAVFHCSSTIEERGYEKRSPFSAYVTRLSHLVSLKTDFNPVFAVAMRYLLARPSADMVLDRFVSDTTRVLYPDKPAFSMAAPIMRLAGQDVRWLCRLLVSEMYFDAAANLDFEHERLAWLDEIGRQGVPE
ncbi:MAG: hypothetical protein NTY01_14880 [Verrucomicrobia bacterium]|nr:hypothetical protein [Verrucomicrobiota bacterium]